VLERRREVMEEWWAFLVETDRRPESARLWPL